MILNDRRHSFTLPEARSHPSDLLGPSSVVLALLFVTARWMKIVRTWSILNRRARRKMTKRVVLTNQWASCILANGTSRDLMEFLSLCQATSNLDETLRIYLYYPKVCFFFLVDNTAVLMMSLTVHLILSTCNLIHLPLL